MTIEPLLATSFLSSLPQCVACFSYWSEAAEVASLGSVHDACHHDGYADDDDRNHNQWKHVQHILKFKKNYNKMLRLIFHALLYCQVMQLIAPGHLCEGGLLFVIESNQSHFLTKNVLGLCCKVSTLPLPPTHQHQNL